MSKIGLSADCSSGLEYCNFKHNIRITRTMIHFGDENLLDGVDITADEFYDKVKSSEVVPSTSAPSPKELLGAFEALKEQGCDEIIHFPISWGLSDYGVNLEASLGDMVDGVKIHSFHTRTACLMQGYVAKYAEICASHGLTAEEIIEECDILNRNIRAFFVVDDLKYLIKNGRLSVLKGLIGQLLKIKPIIHFTEEGRLETLEKIRTSSKAVARCKELLFEHGSKFKKCIYLSLHTGRKEDCIELGEQFKKEFSNLVRLECSVITPTVGAHVGNGLLGMACLPIDGLKFGDELANL